MCYVFVLSFVRNLMWTFVNPTNSGERQLIVDQIRQALEAV
jgi:hypothetical protein